MIDDIRIIRGNNKLLRDRLDRDASDVALFLRTTRRNEEFRLAVLIPYAWSERRPFLCGVSSVTFANRELAALGKDMLLHLGWRFNHSADAADYLEFPAMRVSCHRKLLAIGRIRSAIKLARYSPTIGQ